MLLTLVLALVSLAHADSLYTTEATSGVRWPGSAQVTLELAKGDEVEVLLHDGALVRVRKGGDFGWVAEAKLSGVKPELPPVESLPVVPAPTPTEPPPASPAPQ